MHYAKANCARFMLGGEKKNKSWILCEALTIRLSLNKPLKSQRDGAICFV